MPHGSAAAKQGTGHTVARWIILGVVAAVIAAVIALGIYKHWFSLDALSRERTALQRLISGHYVVALLATMAACFVLVSVSAPVSGAITFLSGMLFGRWVGTAAVVISVSLGATAAMLLVRYVLKSFVRKHVHAHESTRKIMKNFNHHQNSYLLFMRLAPGVPMWLSNVLLGLTDIPAWRFLALTVVGILPDTFIYCNVGATLISAKGIFSAPVLISLGLLALLSLTPVAIRQLKKRHILPPGWPFSRA